MKKPSMTDEERLELAKKLDADLDEFINNLPRKKYEGGWPEDRWEEEIAEHPFFMKDGPQPGQKLHPLYEGLQKLKYDPEENEPQELAIAYKDDGNFNFKHKNYRLAIISYSEGIKQKCGDLDIEASLLNNRSAAHWFLKNYRSSLRDCELALKLKPDYDKVLIRAANCCYETRQYQKAIEYCDKILERSKTNKDILELRKKCVIDQKKKERDERKREIEDKKKLQDKQDLINEILRRGYRIEGGRRGKINLSQLEPCFPELRSNRVFIDPESKHLVWPVALVYPEFQIFDYIQKFDEKNSLLDHLNVVFEEHPQWDTQQKYKIQCVNVYFENERQKMVKVDVNLSLEEVLKSKGYIIKAGTPSFLIVVKDSEVEKKLLNQ